MLPERQNSCLASNQKNKSICPNIYDSLMKLFFATIAFTEVMGVAFFPDLFKAPYALVCALVLNKISSTKFANVHALKNQTYGHNEMYQALIFYSTITSS